ncbi:MAG: hypothetical protein IPH16_19715 [Haliscomenobacter sp.]|nr:hypothetical protein [Haliscomenobacter sp.]
MIRRFIPPFRQAVFGSLFLVAALLAGCNDAAPEQIPPPREGELAAQVLAPAGSTDVWD